MESRVFVFETSGRNYILRLNKSEEGFRKDALCQKLFASYVPIPEIIEYGRFDETVSFCISDFVNGVTLEDITVRQLPALIPQVQELQENISRLPTGDIAGFGPFNSNAKTAHSRWHAYLRELANPNAWTELTTNLKQPEVEIVTNAIRLYENLIKACPEIKAIYHGDFGSNNVLVDEGKIAAIIDWDCAGIGDPLWDIAGAYYWSTHLDCMRLQAEHAQETLSHLPNYQQRIECYQLKVGLTEIQEELGFEGSKDRLQWFIERLAQTTKSVSL